MLRTVNLTTSESFFRHPLSVDFSFLWHHPLSHHRDAWEKLSLQTQACQEKLIKFDHFYIFFGYKCPHMMHYLQYNQGNTPSQPEAPQIPYCLDLVVDRSASPKFLDRFKKGYFKPFPPFAILFVIPPNILPHFGCTLLGNRTQPSKSHPQGIWWDDLSLVRWPEYIYRHHTIYIHNVKKKSLAVQTIKYIN